MAGKVTAPPRTVLVDPQRHGAYDSIGAAIVEVPDGTCVAVAAGTYPETLELVHRSISLTAAVGTEVIIDGTGSDVAVPRAMAGSLTVRGLTVRAVGVLPRGEFKEVSRRDLVGQYIGHTAEKTSSVFEEALGGVLFMTRPTRCPGWPAAAAISARRPSTRW